MIPTPDGLALTRSVTARRLDRNPEGAVVGSRPAAIPATAPDPTGVLRGVAELARKAGSAVQSAVGLFRERTDGAGESRWSSVLARVESQAGPVLLGAATAADPTILLDAPAVRAGAGLPREPADGAPPDWADRPLVLRPPVAALLVAGAALALGSVAGRRLLAARSGRPILPGLSLADVPLLPGESEPDDLGDKAEVHELVRAGRAVAPVPPLSISAAAPEPVRGLRLTGPHRDPPMDALDLAWCVEGLQRYHSDGTVNLACIVGTADWFPLTIRARPLVLLRAVRGCVGPAWTVSTDRDVITPALLLPPARELRSKDDDASPTVVYQR